MRSLDIRHISSPLAQTFAISRGAKTSAETLQVSIEDNGKIGRGECVPYARYGETINSVRNQIESLRADLEKGMDLNALQAALSAGAARCAIDCALWDLNAKMSGTPVWKRAGLNAPSPLPTTMTLSLDTPSKMQTAARATPAKILKLKLGGASDLDCVETVHSARPDAKLILDGNEGLDPAEFPTLVARASKYGTVLIEQPFPVDADEALFKRPGHVSICADESVHSKADIQRLSKKYDAVNIKLDKAGGFTEALGMIHEARACGMGVMIGCMVAGSLSMAPALVLGQLADVIDLDGPLWLACDVDEGLTYKDGTVSPPHPNLWG